MVESESVVAREVSRIMNKKGTIGLVLHDTCNLLSVRDEKMRGRGRKERCYVTE